MFSFSFQGHSDHTMRFLGWALTTQKTKVLKKL
jgi:hypothetical protein